MSAPQQRFPKDCLVFSEVSKFYGEVMGLGKVSLSIPPGITSLVGPNGSGKSTLMNLLTGLLRPTRGKVSVLGITADHPEQLFHRVGYCSQYDSFPKGMNGRQFINSYLLVHGYSPQVAKDLTERALDRVKMTYAAGRRIGAYSKGMRQRIKLAQAIAHEPEVLILDEPLNGLDPLARAEIIDLFSELSEQGRHVLISSHILHEVDLISDWVIILKGGFVVAEGDIQGVRSEINERPFQISIRCDAPGVLASRVFEKDSVVEARMHDDQQGLIVATKDVDSFYLLLNKLVLEDNLAVEGIMPADENVHAVYRYLVGQDGEGT